MTQWNLRLAGQIFVVIVTIASQVTYAEERSCPKPKKGNEMRPEWYNVTFPPDYNRKLPPKKPNGCPSVITLGIYPWKIGEISFERMTFEVDILLSVRWVDPRLNFTSVNESDVANYMIIHEKEAEKMWIPVVAFRNTMGHNGVIFNPKTDILRIRKQNQASFVIRRVERFHCQFYFGYYPLDRHKCFVEVQSLNYKTSVSMEHSVASYGLMSNSQPPQFEVEGFDAGPCSTKDDFSTYYACIEYSFIFTRHIAHHLMLTYGPSLLIVMLSWISFWLDVDAVPPRVALGLTSLLTLATQFANAQKNIPPVSYLKAIDVWMFCCIFMVFAALVESAIVNYSSRWMKLNSIIPVKEASVVMDHRKPPIARSYVHLAEATAKEVQTPTNTNAGEDHAKGLVAGGLWRLAGGLVQVALLQSCKGSNKANIPKSNASKKAIDNPIDRAARVIFPSFFLVFNICYWAHYQSGGDL